MIVFQRQGAKAAKIRQGKKNGRVKPGHDFSV
jgi:hypothetical protein